MVHTPVDIHQVKRLAATGHFRSIALWLNYPLVPQSIYARVQTDQYPGYLQILLEFERPPKQETLIRLVCHRLCQLESHNICGAHVVGRLLGSDQPLWQRRIKLKRRRSSLLRNSAPAVPRSADVSPIPASPTKITSGVEQSSPTLSPSEASEPHPPEDASNVDAETITATTTYGGDTLAVPSYLIPRDTKPQERRRWRSVAPSPIVQIRSADIDSAKTPGQRREQRRRLAPKEIIEQQFNYMRAIVVTGSAAAAFILGCVTETVTSKKGEIAKKSEPTLPTFNRGGWRPLSDVEVQEIAYRSSMREAAVPAALETVAVMPHEPSSDPQDPTVTLVFGGEVAVGDVPIQTPEAVGQVLGDLDMFRAADVAMVGLGNSLATADTSLQESYFDRSRPEAVDALRQGGIDIVALTGDRTMDYGYQGLTETLETLDSGGIYRVGAGRDQQEARRPEVLEVKGQRIAYLSYAPESDEAATLGRAGLNIQERDGIVEDIAALREAVDWIVVNYRWYGDLAVAPSQQQIDLSKSAIDAGADLVVGYHPETIQGAELYKSRPIVYSLGDFVFQDEPLADHDTATLRVSLREKQMKVEFLPVSVRNAQPKTASGEAAKAILQKIRQASDALPSPLEFPTILETPPQKEPLLKPDKPAAPLKTLGELEPGVSNTSAGSPDRSQFAPESDAFVPDTFDGWRSEPEDWVENRFEDAATDGYGEDGYGPERYGPERYGPDSYQPNEFLTPGPDSTSPAGVSDPWLTIDEPSENMPQLDGLPANSLDTFNTRPDLEMDGLDDSEDIFESPTPLPPVERGLDATNSSESMSVPAVETWPSLDTRDDSLDMGAPVPRDEILAPADAPLPGYDALEDWGEKLSPHEEFNPIQERLNGLESSAEESDGLLPAVLNDGTDAKEETVDAISPHHEPLVGPLSRQPADDGNNKLT